MREPVGLLPPAPGSFNTETGTRSSEGGKWDTDKVRLYTYYYYRMVEMVDAEVGRVYDVLRNSRHADNTLFVFTSDHGEMGGHHGLFKKGQFFDAALRVPLVCVFGDRAKVGRRDSEHLVSGIDIPATILDYAGIEPMPKMTVAKSLRPLLEGKRTKWRDYVVAESNSADGPHRAVCMKDFKAVLNQDRSASLYSVKDDPLEMRDLAQDPKYAEPLGRARAFHNEYIDRITLHPRLKAFGKI